jgi:lipoate-protein ligase A
MKWLDLTFPAPAENLACDEALLDWCEDESGEEILRFWEPQNYFVVVGYANKISLEVDAAACAKNKIPIYRRCSGGGTVVQGPGCLNYSLILNFSKNQSLQSITAANRFIMKKNREAIEAEIKIQNPEVRIAVRGHTDLTLITHHSSLVTSKKFSGNAQRRKKNFLLFHGTFLLDFDLSLIEKNLPMPSRQPEYREDRRHTEFLTNLPLSADAVKNSLRKIWQAGDALETIPKERAELLARDKYVTDAWNLKF